MTGRSGPGSKAKGKANNAALADLRREVEVMRALSHPNLVRLYEVIDDKESGKLLMVVEFCEAGALVRPGQLTPERRMPESIAQFYFRQMVSGLAYLHANGVIHGDMKPENVLLSGDATVKIADFGQSQFMSEGEDTLRRTLGTPMYLSPEICAGEDYKGRPADVWALGVSLYVFIYGELPFRGSSLLELYEDIAESPVPFPPNVPVSIELQDLLLRTLCKEPEARITADELLRHPWIREDDLITLMPSLFYGDDLMMGGSEGDNGGLFGGSPHSASGISDASGQVSPAASSFNSRHSFMPENEVQRRMTAQVAAPTAEDVAAVVFPSLFSARPGDDGGFTLGPQTSIIGALLHAEHAGAGKDKVLHQPTRLHLLANDSMVHSSLPEDGSSSDGDYVNDSNNERSVRSTSASEISVDDSTDLEVALRPPGEAIKSKSSVERSAPSAFTVMAQQAQQVQASLLAQRQQLHLEQEQGQASMEGEVGGTSAGGAGSGGLGGLKGSLGVGGTLETIEETSGNSSEVSEGEGDEEIRSGSDEEDSVPSETDPPGEPEEEITAAVEGKKETRRERHRRHHKQRMSKLSGWITGQTAAPAKSAATGSSGSSLQMSATGDSNLSVAKSSQSQSLTFSDSSSLYMMSPFASDSLPSASFTGPAASFVAPPPPGKSVAPAAYTYQQKVRQQFGGNPPTEPNTVPAVEVQRDIPTTTTTTQVPGAKGEEAATTAISKSNETGTPEPRSGIESGPGLELSLGGTNGIAEESPGKAVASSSGGGGGGGGGSSGEASRSTGPTAATGTASDSGEAASKQEGSTGRKVSFRHESNDVALAEKEKESDEHAASTSGKGRIQSLLTRLSFKSNNSGLHEADAAAATAGDKGESSSGPGSGPSFRPSSASGSGKTEPLIQWCSFRTGQKLALYTGVDERNTVYYLESGTVELRWEASLPVTLTSVLNTMQQMPDQRRAASPDVISTRQSLFLDNADSVALTMPTVANLAKFGQHGSNNSNNSNETHINRSETLARTLQQATQRAEALMKNATGGSIDNLLLSHRSGSQYVGLLSMVDPEFFAMRWRANAVALSDVVAIRMNRQGLDQFLAQNPLAQVHLRASMARARAEITKLESLERIADAFRRSRDGVGKPAVRKRSWKISDMGKAFGVTVAEATEAALGPVDEGEEVPRRKSNHQQETAGLEVFALVSRLRPPEEKK